MFSVNFKLSNKHIAILFVVIVAASLLVVSLRLKWLNKPTVKGIECSTNSEVRDYVASFGLELGECTKDEVLIPYEFNEVYNSYNKIQKSQGFDLGEFKGQSLKRYTFSVQNHPDGENVYVEVLIYESRIVGADVYSTDLEGFIAPLK